MNLFCMYIFFINSPIFHSFPHSFITLGWPHFFTSRSSSSILITGKSCMLLFLIAFDIFVSNFLFFVGISICFSFFSGVYISSSCYKCYIIVTSGVSFDSSHSMNFHPMFMIVFDTISTCKPFLLVSFWLYLFVGLYLEKFEQSLARVYFWKWRPQCLR